MEGFQQGIECKKKDEGLTRSREGEGETLDRGSLPKILKKVQKLHFFKLLQFFCFFFSFFLFVG